LPVQLITLITDFGTQDWFVGTTKGVILGINPRAAIVDITHEIPPGSIRAGAFALMASCRYFPKDTVHVVVVDPGVGSARKAIAVQTANYLFVGPDNGVLSFALARENIKTIHRLENETYFLQRVSQTFHGRDIFAPVAAHLSRGVPIHKFGRRQKEFARLEWPVPRTTRTGIEGEVVYFDRFGNAITNIETATLVGRVDHEVRAGDSRICGVKSFYHSVGTGEAAAVPGSSGFLEIAINGGSAEKTLHLKIGSRLTVQCAGRRVKSR
jgi:S-adenosyl-L-methionine hydrolase (adenosine-forming)